MDRAINKKTNQVIDALEVHNNGSYQNLNKGEWISPKDSIYNWEELEKENIKEIPVHYVKEKEYENWRRTKVLTAPYFAIYPNSKAKTINESPQHKAIKNWLFTKIKKDDLKLIYSTVNRKNKYEHIIKLSELDINWNEYDIEVTVRGIKSFRADILLPFNKKHNLFGNGIVFEIQLSEQSKNRTFERNIERFIQGYSIVWIFKNEIKHNKELTDIELVKNEVKLQSFASGIKYVGDKFIKTLRFSVEEQCRYLDDKKQELNETLEESALFKENLFNELKKKINGFFSFKIKELSSNFNEEIVNKIQEEFFEKNREKIENIILDVIKSYINFDLLNKIVDKINIEEAFSEARSLAYKKISNKIQSYSLYREFMSNPPLCPNCQIKIQIQDGKYGVWGPCPNKCGFKLSKNQIPKEVREILEVKDGWVS